MSGNIFKWYKTLGYVGCCYLSPPPPLHPAFTPPPPPTTPMPHEHSTFLHAEDS